MPELPEVETVVRGLRPRLKDCVAGLAWVDWPKVLDGYNLTQFNKEVKGQALKGIHRRGKYICLALDTHYLVVHLRMTGRLYVSSNKTGDDKWVHFSLAIGDQQFLAFSDARKFGRVTLTRSLDYLEEKLGPEPLPLPREAWLTLLSGTSRGIKAFLLDQKKLAGVGNIYADEALHRTGVDPRRPVNELTPQERTNLGINIQDILAAAINYEGATISWYRKPDGTQGESQKHFKVYGKTGEPCSQCGNLITRITVAQRSTHFCPTCQS